MLCCPTPKEQANRAARAAWEKAAGGAETKQDGLPRKASFVFVLERYRECELFFFPDIWR